MDWNKRIITDNKVLLGKPIVKGTRISVEFIISRLADGWTEKDLLDNYPRLTKDDLQAVFAYIEEAIQDGLLINYPSQIA